MGGEWNQLGNFYTQHVGFYCRNAASSGNHLARLNLPLDRRLREPQNLALRLSSLRSSGPLRYGDGRRAVFPTLMHSEWQSAFFKIGRATVGSATL